MFEFRKAKEKVITFVTNEFDILSLTVDTTFCLSAAYVPGPIKKQMSFLRLLVCKFKEQEKTYLDFLSSKRFLYLSSN